MNATQGYERFCDKFDTLILGDTLDQEQKQKKTMFAKQNKRCFLHKREIT